MQEMKGIIMDEMGIDHSQENCLQLFHRYIDNNQHKGLFDVQQKARLNKLVDNLENNIYLLADLDE